MPKKYYEVIFPTREEMLKRLKKTRSLPEMDGFFTLLVDTIEKYIILKKILLVEDVAIMFIFVTANYAVQKTTTTSIHIINLIVPSLIEAIIDDTDIAKEIKDWHLKYLIKLDEKFNS